jgi:hypothetical protein
MLVGLSQGDKGRGILLYFILFYFILFYFYNTHQVLVGAFPRGCWPCYYDYFVLVYYYNTHQMLVELPQGDGCKPSSCLSKWP